MTNALERVEPVGWNVPTSVPQGTHWGNLYKFRKVCYTEYIRRGVEVVEILTPQAIQRLKIERFINANLAGVFNAHLESNLKPSTFLVNNGGWVVIYVEP